jgi:N-acetyl-D-muramate 6-phosphate phosphatase
MSVPLYIFDLDGTLIDSYPQVYRAFCLALDSVDEPTPDALLLSRCMGTSMSQTIEQLYSHWSNERRVSFRRAFGEAYSSLFMASVPFEGASDVIELCNDRCAIVTNKEERWARPIVDQFGWQHVPLICPTDRADRKPSPSMIQRAKAVLLARYQSDVIVSVGDTLADKQASAAAGVPFVGVGWTTHDLEMPQLIESWRVFAQCVARGELGALDVYLGS